MTPIRGAKASAAREPTRILGIDPGSRRLGWGVVESQGPQLRGVDAGVLRLRSGDSLQQRLHQIYRGLIEIIDRFEPRAVAVESIFHANFADAAPKLGHVRGVVLLAAAERALEVTDLPPSLVKRCISGKGNAEKDQVARLVGAILGWKELPGLDATDALALAITHARSQGGVIGAISKKGAKAKALAALAASASPISAARALRCNGVAVAPKSTSRARRGRAPASPASVGR